MEKLSLRQLIGNKGPATVKVRTKPVLIGAAVVGLVLVVCAIPSVTERILLFKGEAEQLFGLNEAALVDFEEACRKAPHNPVARSHAACMLERCGHYDRAFVYFGELYKNPSTIELATSHLATVCLHRKDYGNALRYAQEWIRLCPKESEAYHAKGSALAQLNRNAEAIAALSEAVRINPSSSAVTERGFLVEKTKVFTEVLDNIVDPPLENKHDDPSALVRDGERLAIAQQFEEAANRFTAAIKLHADPAEYYMRGQCYMRARKFAQAVEDFATIARTNGDEPFNLTVVVPEYRKMVSPDGKDPVVTADGLQRFYGEGLMGLGQYSAAVAHLNKAIKLAPENPDYYLIRSAAYEKLGRQALAEADLNKSREIKAKSPPEPPDARQALIQTIKTEGLPTQR